MRVIDMVGQRFGRLIVMRRAENAKGGQAQWRCRCDCGNEGTWPGSWLRTGNTKSCGCFRVDHSREQGRRQAKHGHCRNGVSSPEYLVWDSMRRRCHNPEASNYDRYGGRGIRVCEQWRESFATFLADMGKRPEGRKGALAAYSIERIDNSRGYELGNCKWATGQEQNRNTRRNVWVTVEGNRMVLVTALEKYGVNRKTYYGRIRSGMTPEEAILTPSLQGRVKNGRVYPHR